MSVNIVTVFSGQLEFILCDRFIVFHNISDIPSNHEIYPTPKCMNYLKLIVFCVFALLGTPKRFRSRDDKTEEKKKSSSTTPAHELSNWVYD